MPERLRVRAAQDAEEDRKVRQLATSQHGPADWIQHAAMVVHRWDGERVEAMAAALHCSAQPVDPRGVACIASTPRGSTGWAISPASDDPVA